jgi:glycine oxidase
METTDVVILGGGVIGCAIAYALRKRHVAVTVLERGEIGGQASSAAAGLLAPLGPLSGPGPFADLVLAGFSSLTSLVPEIEECSGICVGYEQTGALRMIRNPKRIPHLQKRLKSWQPLGLQMSWLSGEEACKREPLLAPETCAAIYVPEESQIQAASLVHAFARAAQRAGATISPHQEVQHLLLEGHSVRGVTTTQGDTIACQTLILASGAWAAHCGSWLQVELPIQPLHGQLISFSQPSPPLKHIIFGEAGYVIPRGNTILVGATKEERGFDQQVSEQGTAWLSATATRLLPALRERTIQAAWAGLRPKTPDHHPILGLLPPWNNVVVAAGHNSVGVILSAITGECLADLVTTGQISPLIQPFSIERFATSRASGDR